jgi:hypothetical protein
MKGKQFYVFGSISGIIAMIFMLSLGCSNEEVAVPTVPNPDAGPAKLISEVEITQNAFDPSISIKEVGVADPETGELLSTEATEITSGITYTIVGGSCTATNLSGQWQTCCQVNITNGTGASISSVILHGDSAISGAPTAYRTGSSGTGYDGGGTGWGNIAASNGGYALWMVRSATGNVIANGQSSDNRAICLQSTSGYSVSRWRLYRDAILGRIVDRDTGSAITTGGWAMLGMANPDNTNFPELGSGNYVNADSQGNFGFPYLGTTITNFTITAGATNYARQTIIQTTNKNITLKLKSRALRSRVAVGNYNNTLAVVNPNPAPTIGGNCTLLATTNVGCEGFLPIGVIIGAMGYEDIYSLSLDALIGPNQSLTLTGDTGTCNIGSHTTVTLDMPLPSNVIIPSQNEGPLTAAGYNNVYAHIDKMEWWVPAPAQTSNTTIAAVWGQVPRIAVQAIAQGSLNGGPVSVVSLVQAVDPRCTTWQRNITTGISNVQGVLLNINRANNETPLFTLGNMPSSTNPRTVIGIVGIEMGGNPIHQRLNAISLGGGNTTSANIAMRSSNQTLATDETLIPLVLIADLDSRADTYNTDATVAIAARPGGKGTSSATFNTFFSIPALTWATIQANNRRVAFANPERAIGTAGGSPWVDAGVGIISKTSYINTITEETSSCGTGTCCTKKDASNRCQYDQTGTENLWEVLYRGRTTTSAPVTDWILPDLPASVDLPVGDTTSYPDGNYPSLAVTAASWCPGSPLCTANATSNEFGFDTNGNIDDLLNNTTHFATNKFGLGEAIIINPINQFDVGTGTSFDLNGFVAAENWDIVQCTHVYIETWESTRSGTSKSEACGGAPTGGGTWACGGSCPANHYCTTANVALTAGGGCGAGLPPYCFGTITIPINANVWRHVKVTPKNGSGGSTAPDCGNPSSEWYVKRGTPP